MPTLPLSKGYETQVSPERYDFLSQWKWHAKVTVDGIYARRTGRLSEGRYKESIYLHVIVAIEMGVYDSLLEVDHHNGDSLDNRDPNIRMATHAQNQANKRSLKGSSSYKGVSFCRANNKWQAMIAGVYIGYYFSEIEAAVAYDAIAKNKYGPFARLNVPLC